MFFLSPLSFINDAVISLTLLTSTVHKVFMMGSNNLKWIFKNKKANRNKKHFTYTETERGVQFWDEFDGQIPWIIVDVWTKSLACLIMVLKDPLSSWKTIPEEEIWRGYLSPLVSNTAIMTLFWCAVYHNYTVFCLSIFMFFSRFDLNLMNIHVIIWKAAHQTV